MAYVCAEAEDESEPALIRAVCEELEVSPKVAAELLKEYWMMLRSQQLGDDVFLISSGGDPAKAYDRYMRRVLLLELMEDVLTPREMNLVRHYLGIGQPEGGGDDLSGAGDSPQLQWPKRCRESVQGCVV